MLNKKRSWHSFQASVMSEALLCFLCRTVSLCFRLSTTTIAAVKIMVKLLQKQIEKSSGINLGKETLHGFYGAVDELLLTNGIE